MTLSGSANYGVKGSRRSSLLHDNGDQAEEAHEQGFGRARPVDIEVLWVLVARFASLSNHSRLRAEAQQTGLG